ncbi:MAG: rhodanese-like domain-containing protein [Nitrosomonadales bacterium]|nr:rhodanese-like domain-containing protein [Nitrosomonadales bacterium]
MKKSLSFLVLLAALVVPIALAEPLPASMDVTHVATLQSQGVFLLDVREPDEFAKVHAVGATLIPLGQLPSRLGEIARYKDKPVAVICHSGRRSAQGAEILRKAGYTQVVNVEGGTAAWEKAGWPVVRK